MAIKTTTCLLYQHTGWNYRLVLKGIITVTKVDADVDNFDDDDNDMVDMMVVGQVSIGDKMRMRSKLFGLRMTLVSPIPLTLIKIN